MTWLTYFQPVLSIVGGLGTTIAVVFLAGRYFQRLSRGEVGDPKLSPIQRLSVDVEKLGETVTRELAELRRQIGTQYTDVIQRFNIDHDRLRELIQARDNEYARLSAWVYSKEFIDRRFLESEQDRKALRDEFQVFRTQCFDTHHRGGDDR